MPREYVILFFIFKGLFCLCVNTGKKAVLLFSTMVSTNKAFEKCMDPCLRYLTPDDMHSLCIFCLGEDHMRDVLEGAICAHCELFPMRKLCSCLSLFSRKARGKMNLWCSQVDLADELKNSRFSV